MKCSIVSIFDDFANGTNKNTSTEFTGIVGLKAKLKNFTDNLSTFSV